MRKGREKWEKKKKFMERGEPTSMKNEKYSTLGK